MNQGNSGNENLADSHHKAPIEVLSGRDGPRLFGSGRRDHTVYRRELADEICRRIASGETLRVISAEPGMPATATIWDWVNEDRDGFAGRYAKARERQMDAWVEEVLTIADDETIEPNSRRVRVDTRKWLMSKIAYRKFGDKIVHSGDSENPIQVLHNKADFAPLTPNQLEMLEQFAHERAALTTTIEDKQ